MKSVIADALYKKHRSGALYGAGTAIEKVVAAQYGGSKIRAVIEKPYGGESAVLRLLGAISAGIDAGVKAFGRLAQGSKIFNFLGTIGSRLDILMAVWLFVVYCIPHAYWNNAYAVIGIGGILMLYLAAAATGKGPKLAFEKPGLAFLMCVCWITLSFVFSFSWQISLRTYIFQLTGFMIVFLVVSAGWGIKQLMPSLEALCLAGTFAAFYGIYQLIIGVKSPSGQIDSVANPELKTRIFSFFEGPNLFSEILLLIIPISLALFLIEKQPRLKFYRAVMFAIQVLAMVFTYSRSGWGALAISVVIFALFINWRVIPFLVTGAALLVPFMPSTVTTRLITVFTGDSSIWHRGVVYETMSPLITKFHALGVGYGTNITYELTKAFNAEGVRIAPHFHSFYLQQIAEVGVIGLVLELFLVGIAFLCGFRAIKKADRPKKLIVAAFVSSISGLFVTGFVDYFWHYPRVLFLFWFGMAILLSMSRKKISPAE